MLIRVVNLAAAVPTADRELLSYYCIFSKS